MQAYVPLSIYIALALAVPLLITLVAGRLGPRKAEPMKYQPYESGYPTSPLVGRFPVKFYLVAMLFVIFDVEAAAFYPWAVTLREFGRHGLWAMVTFVAVLGVGYAYVWKKVGFTWRS